MDQVIKMIKRRKKEEKGLILKLKKSQFIQLTNLKVKMLLFPIKKMNRRKREVIEK